MLSVQFLMGPINLVIRNVIYAMQRGFLAQFQMGSQAIG
ncbi:hypothetical protein AB3S75_035112 [Citrus x aurantiifolia]